jgi:uncharacterized protein YxjI
MEVEGKFWTLTYKKFIKDLNGNIVYIVRNKFWKFITYQAYIMDKDEKILAHVKRKAFSLHDHYSLVTEDGREIILRGNILGYDYHIYVDGKEVGHVARRISLRDSYVLDLDDDQDPMFFVALLIAMDNITDEMQNSAS